MSEVLPPYWYQLQGEGLDYLSGLLGLDENTTTYLLKMMGVLKDHGESVRFEQIVFQDALTMVGAEGCSHHGWCRGGSRKPNMKVETSSMSTRSAASPKLKALWFLRIGRSRTSEDYNRIAYNKASDQV